MIQYPSEHEEQKAVMKWAAIMSNQYPVLRLLHAIPNGGPRNPVTAARLKAEGVKAGVPDLCLPVARQGYHAFYIELKRRKGGQVKPEQKQWIEDLQAQGNRVDVCRGFDEAIKALLDYLNQPTQPEGARPNDNT